MTDPILVFQDPDDPDYVYMSRCILCGLPPAEHTEEACDAKMRAWKPRGFLSAWEQDHAPSGEAAP